jgi:hypothetical protein
MVNLPDNYLNILEDNFMNTSNTSKNATSHGAYSAEVVLDWENKDEFQALHKAYLDELNPVGRDEEGLVFDLVCLRWKKRRVNFGSQLAFRRTPDVHKLTDAGRNGGWEAIADYLAPSAQDADSLRAKVCDSAKKCLEASTYVTDRMAKLAPKIGEPGDIASTPASNAAQGSMDGLIALLKMLQICSGDLTAALRRLEDHNGRLCELAYHPDIMERELKLHAMIDKQMEKTMQRLVNAKEYKKMYRPKLVGESSPGMKSLAANELGE